MGCGQSKKEQNINNGKGINIAEEEKKKKNSKELEIKICLLGDVSVGKTSIASFL